MRFSAPILATLVCIQSSYAFAPLARHSVVQSSSTKSSLGVAGTTSSAPARSTVATVPKVAQRWRKSTKQLVTLGPASSSYEMIEKLFLAGADVFRLNFSHGSQEQKKELLMTIREIEEKYSHPIGILGDLQGPKLRVSNKC
jgi:pyruvate kinase